MSIRASAAVTGLAVTIIACGGSAAAPTSTHLAEQSSVVTPSSAVPPTSSPTTSPTTSSSSPPPDSLAARPVSPCERTGTEVAGRVATADLTEASGLAASRTHPGVLWSHNDGGRRPGVFAIGPDGIDLGFHDLPVEAVDIEDMAIAGGVGGDVLYLADIGDNNEARPSISVFRFAEPDPASPGPIESFERFDFTYPDRLHNAEALLVDERNSHIVVVTKEQAANADGTPDATGATEVSFVFEGALEPTPPTAPTTLTEVGVVDTLRLEQLATSNGIHPATIFGFGGVVTGGDVAADGSLVALRTYETVWVWERRAEQSVAGSLVSDAQPCEVTTISEVQGEAVAFDGDELVTIAEGEQPPINRLGR